MPRPKGSKNKASQPVNSIEDINAQIAAAEAEIESITAQLKARKAELKALNKARVDAERIAAEQKAETEKATILAAVAASGKSVEEILELLK